MPGRLSPLPSPADRTLDANEAVADVAYRLSEIIAIYPITPASPMGEHADAWAADRRPNLFGMTPEVLEMQSEGGAAGAVHGALQAGALTTTFTASQGLLLMLPNLYKIAGELTPFCLHVAARAIATHALSIFGDHSDVMSARGTGFALLASNSAQEAQDMAAIAHAATLRGRIPVLHFFDGFRTSHEISRVTPLADAQLAALVDPTTIAAHRARALDPDRPVIRGTAQNPDVFFQGREAVTPFHDAFPNIVGELMADFGILTGRHYRLFEYAGHPEAEHVLVLMGSGAACASETAEWLAARGERVGVVTVRLYRPFATDAFLAALPRTARTVTVLDRTKEPGSIGEPLLLDVIAALQAAADPYDQPDTEPFALPRILPRIMGGRYGLGSKEFTPAMVKAVFDNATSASPRRRFTVGIRDDISGTSLAIDPDFDIEPDDVIRALFFGLGSDGTVSANKATIKLVGDSTPLFVQGHFEYDSRKAGSTTISHLRFSPRPIRATHRIEKAHFIAVHDPSFFERRDILSAALPGAIVLVNTPLAPERFVASLPVDAMRHLMEARCRLFVLDGYGAAVRAGLGRIISTTMQAAFLALSGLLPRDEALTQLRRSIEKTWGRRGPEVLRRNLAALDSALEGLVEVPLPTTLPHQRVRPPAIADGAPDFVGRVTRLLLEGRGDELPVSAFPPDGTWPTATSRYEKRALATTIPIWQSDLCIQCNQCSMVCPHAAIRTKVFEPAALTNAPATFRSVPETFDENLAGQRYVVQVAPEDCTGCGLCIEICPAKDRTQPKRKALVPEPLAAHREAERDNWDFFAKLPSTPLAHLPVDRRTAVFREPYFEFPGACAGCGETPYLRLLTQLFGDHLLVANATGCSSIYGANLPTTPWSTDAAGRGPAWANSLFEDNAEFGLGMRLAVDMRAARAKTLLQQLSSQLPAELVAALSAERPADIEPDAWRETLRQHVADLRALLAPTQDLAASELHALADALVPRSVWIVGGDGWAYDIGYGGLDHVLASTRKVNVLVLDTEVYSNTGGQASKATPLGAAAKFATAGKATRKKDLGLLAMSYGHVYVASVALEARSPHTLKAFLEAEAHPGPSLIIAHSPCVAHGYDLINSPAQQRRAVQSGLWPLYRFDPQRAATGLAPLQLDSVAPTLDIGAAMEQEGRFRMVQLRDPDRWQTLLSAARDAARQRRDLYEQLARIHPGGGHDE
jgi:pyruvate-ferredoxin/flavodoxin oxidoreductase